MVAAKGCWTCKDRKVSCDRTVPRCLKCKKTKRECGGYGIRLTWPQDDRSRALVGLPQPKQTNLPARQLGHQWVNVVPTDLRLHLVTCSFVGKGRDLARDQLAFPNIPELIPTWCDDGTNDEAELMRYFESVVIHLLPMLYTDRTRLCRLLLKTARSNRSPSSKAVHHAILALSSYLRDGASTRVDRLKQEALHALYIEQLPSECDAIEHISANLLLCVLELQQTSGNGSCWIGFITGVKQVVDAVKRADIAPDGDAGMILGWVYYFDVMVRFSLRHWRSEYIEATAKALGFDPKGEQECLMQYILARKSFARGLPAISNHAHAVVRLLAEISETAVYSSDARYLTQEYQLHLNELRTKLQNVSPRTQDVALSSNEPLNHTENMLELTRLAGLIHLERVSRNFSGHSASIRSWTKEALAIITELDSCFCPFALFVVSCELMNDEERLIILDLYTRIETRPHLHSFMEVKLLIQTAWNQQDLAEDGELEYIQKLNLVMSSRNVVPSLV